MCIFLLHIPIKIYVSVHEQLTLQFRTSFTYDNLFKNSGSSNILMPVGENIWCKNVCMKLISQFEDKTDSL